MQLQVPGKPMRLCRRRGSPQRKNAIQKSPSMDPKTAISTVPGSKASICRYGLAHLQGVRMHPLQITLHCLHNRTQSKAGSCWGEPCRWLPRLLCSAAGSSPWRMTQWSTGACAAVTVSCSKSSLPAATSRSLFLVSQPLALRICATQDYLVTGLQVLQSCPKGAGSTIAIKENQ